MTKSQTNLDALTLAREGRLFTNGLGAYYLRPDVKSTAQAVSSAIATAITQHYLAGNLANDGATGPGGLIAVNLTAAGTASYNSWSAT